ncbi:MAG: hypothetical protein NTW16_08505 [Bacteroidetes bacterium]|nr:hypothetical protein [Bacteroidota bacterium]
MCKICATILGGALSKSGDPFAGLDVNFNNKGFLPPRMTTAESDADEASAGWYLHFSGSSSTPFDFSLYFVPVAQVHIQKYIK